MRPLTKLLAVAVLSGTAFVGSSQAQFTTPLRPTLPAGVKPVPTTPPSFAPVHPGILPGGYAPRPFPNPGPFPPPAIDIDYKVFYRTCSHDRWRYYTTVESGREARRIERYLEAHGYQVDVVEKFDREHSRHDGHRH